MNNEIKLSKKEIIGICEFLKIHHFENVYILLDYITNLQKTNKNHSKKLIELGDKITNLQQENERLKELNENASKVCMAEHKYGVDKAEEARDYKSRCEKVIEYITSYEAISTIQGLDKIEQNKTLDERTMNVMVERYLQVHHNLLNILQNGSDDNGNN